MPSPGTFDKASGPQVIIVLKRFKVTYGNHQSDAPSTMPHPKSGAAILKLNSESPWKVFACCSSSNDATYAQLSAAGRQSYCRLGMTVIHIGYVSYKLFRADRPYCRSSLQKPRG